MRAKTSVLFVLAIALLTLASGVFLEVLDNNTAVVPSTQPLTTGEPAMEGTILPVPSPETTLARLKEALAVTIEDSWAGLGNPYKAHYELERHGTGLLGKARFEAGWSERLIATADIAV